MEDRHNTLTDGSNAWPQRATWFTVVAALSLAERGGAPGAFDTEDALEF